MDIKQLTYFLKIVQERTITEAAKKLHMAQPPLSQQMKELEKELGVQLMNRDRKGITLTEAGKTLCYRSEQIVELLQLTKKEIQDLQAGTSGMLTIGTVASSGAAFLPERIRLFHRQYPAVNFQFWEGDTAEVMALLQCGVVELGIARLADGTKGCDMVSFAAEPFVAAFPTCLSAEDETDTISLTSLPGFPC